MEPTELDALWAKDPKEYTDAELLTLISHLRAGRERWAAEESRAKKTGKKVRASEGMIGPVTQEQIDLLESGLEDMRTGIEREEIGK